VEGPRKSLANALRKGQPDLLVKHAVDEGLLRVDFGEIDLRDPSCSLVQVTRHMHGVDLPFSPLPAELEVAKVVRKPVHEAVGKFHVHRLETAE
jgi:hypothetical protein